MVSIDSTFVGNLHQNLENRMNVVTKVKIVNIFVDMVERKMTAVKNNRWAHNSGV